MGFNPSGFRSYTTAYVHILFLPNLHNQGTQLPLQSVSSILRAWLFLLFGIVFSRLVFRDGIIQSGYFYAVVLFSVLFSLIYFLYLDSSVKRPFSVSLFFLSTTYVLLYKRMNLFFVSIVIFGFVVLVSGFRVYYLYFLMFVLAYIISNFRLRDSARFFLSLFLMSIFTYLFWDDAWLYFMDWVKADESRYHQIVYKSLELYDYVYGYGAADESTSSRYSQYVLVFENIGCCLLPNGFLSNSDYIFDSLFSSHSLDFGGRVVSKDSIFLNLLISLGLVIFIPLASYSLVLMVRLLNFWFLMGHGVVGLYVLLGLCLIIFGQGSVLTVTYNSFYMGALLALYYYFPVNNIVVSD